MLMFGTMANAQELKTLPKDVAAELGDIYIYNVWSKYNYVAYGSLFFGLVFFVLYCVFTAIGKNMPKLLANISLSSSA